MFGLFSKNPPAALQNELGRQASQASQAFFYISTKQHVVPSPSFKDDPVDCSSEQDRQKLIETINRIIEANGLLLNNEIAAQSEVINSLVRTNAAMGALDKFDDAAVFLLALLQCVNTVGRTYYKEFPESKALFKLVNQLAKVASPALVDVFGDDYPNNLRKLFPHVSSLLESYRANSNF